MIVDYRFRINVLVTCYIDIVWSVVFIHASPSQWTEQIQRWQQGGAPHPQMYSLQDASRHKCMNDSAADYQECREDVSADSQNKTDYSEHHLTQQGPQTSPSQEPLVMSKTDSEQKAENYTSSTLTSSANFQQVSMFQVKLLNVL